MFVKKLRSDLGPELSPFSPRGSKQSSESEVQNLQNRRSSPPSREQGGKMDLIRRSWTAPLRLRLPA